MSISQLTAVFSPSDEISRSLLTVHLAGPEALMIDFGLPFGALDTLLNVVPAKTWSDLLPIAHDLTAELLAPAVTPAGGHGGLLAAPPPAETEALTPAHVTALLTTAREGHDRIVMDISAAWRASQITALSLADCIAFVVRADIPGLVTGQRCLALLKHLGLRERVRLVVAATPPPMAVSHAEIADLLGPIHAVLPWDPAAVIRTRNLGEPRLGTGPMRQALADIALGWEPAPGVSGQPVGASTVWQRTGYRLRGLMAKTVTVRPV
ncbi:MAG: hypothetical protein H7338_20180 [Candidatus Sericytochromatia bacterium]|nr:hypothetical protein [Candidatus Sericytochromatia bacterium]